MPLPKPTSGETPRDYVSRFMKDANAQEDFPEEGQRLAIAYSYLRRAGYDASAVAEMAASIDLAGEWDESLHPRGKGGEFASEGGAKDKDEPPRDDGGQKVVATNILKQLGGNRFLAMTGAKDFVSSPSSLMFKVPRSKDGSNKMKITLTDQDDYTVETFSIRGADVTTKTRMTGIYAEDLQRTFTDITGLYTHLSADAPKDALSLAGEWDEALHPRGKGGEFTSGGEKGAADKPSAEDAARYAKAGIDPSYMGTLKSLETAGSPTVGESPSAAEARAREMATGAKAPAGTWVRAVLKGKAPGVEMPQPKTEAEHKEFSQTLTHALTQYDQKQMGKKGYNPYAMGIYFGRAKDVEEEVKGGRPLREALTKGFTGRLLDVVLKAVGQPKSTRDEQMGLRVDPAQAFDLVGRHWGTGQWVSGPADHGTPAVERQRIQQTQGEHSYDPSTGQTFGDKGAVISDGLYARPDYGMDRAWQEARDASASAVAGPGLADRVSRDKEAVAYIADKLVPLQAEDARVDGWLQSAEQSLTSAEIALNDVALVRAAVRMEQAEAQAYATFGVKVLPSDAGLLPELRAHMWRAAEAKYASWLLGLAKTAAETAGPVAIANLSGEQPAPHTPAKPLAERTGEVQVTPIVAPLATAPKPDETSKNMDPGLTLVAKRAEKERQKIGVVAPNTIAPAINMAEQEGELKPSSPEGGGAIQSLPAGIEDRAVAVNPKPSNRVAKAVRLSDTFGRTWE